MDENGRPEIIAPLDEFDGASADDVSVTMFGTWDQWGPPDSAPDEPPF